MLDCGNGVRDRSAVTKARNLDWWVSQAQHILRVRIWKPCQL